MGGLGGPVSGDLRSASAIVMGLYSAFMVFRIGAHICVDLTLSPLRMPPDIHGRADQRPAEV